MISEHIVDIMAAITRLSAILAEWQDSEQDLHSRVQASLEIVIAALDDLEWDLRASLYRPETDTN